MELLILANIVLRTLSLETNAGNTNTTATIKITTIANTGLSILVPVLFFGFATSFLVSITFIPLNFHSFFQPNLHSTGMNQNARW
jgi:hypothetical protein